MVNIFKILFAGLGIISWFSSSIYWDRLCVRANMAYRPAEGRIFELYNHGGPFYITKFEYYFVHGLIFGGFSLLCLSAILHVISVFRHHTRIW
jgi:hypothetical protein